MYVAHGSPWTASTAVFGGDLSHCDNPDVQAVHPPGAGWPSLVLHTGKSNLPSYYMCGGTFATQTVASLTLCVSQMTGDTLPVVAVRRQGPGGNVRPLYDCKSAVWAVGRQLSVPPRQWKQICSLMQPGTWSKWPVSVLRWSYIVPGKRKGNEQPRAIDLCGLEEFVCHFVPSQLQSFRESFAYHQCDERSASCHRSQPSRLDPTTDRVARAGHHITTACVELSDILVACECVWKEFTDMGGIATAIIRELDNLQMLLSNDNRSFGKQEVAAPSDMEYVALGPRTRRQLNEMLDTKCPDDVPQPTEFWEHMQGLWSSNESPLSPLALHLSWSMINQESLTQRLARDGKNIQLDTLLRVKQSSTQYSWTTAETGSRLTIPQCLQMRPDDSSTSLLEKRIEHTFGPAPCSTILSLLPDVFRDLSQCLSVLQSAIQSLNPALVAADEDITIVLLVTPPCQVQIATTHRDDTDVLSVVFLGEKIWDLTHEHYVPQHMLLNNDNYQAPDFNPETSEVKWWRARLTAGSVLYVPEGMWHRVTSNGQTGTLTINFCFNRKHRSKRRRSKK
jgi:hypothetical protein